MTDGESKETAAAKGAETSTGVGADEVTAVVPDIHPTQAAPELAWSVDDPSTEPESTGHPWRRAWMISAILLSVGVVVAFVIETVGWTLRTTPATVPPSPVAAAPAPAPAPSPQPSLDGTYLVVFDNANATFRGDAVPPQHLTSLRKWWAFRSRCESTGCTANGVQLDDVNHTKSVVIGMSTLNFVNGQWVEVPVITSETDVPGCDTASSAWALRPQPDGTLAGTFTSTVEGSCVDAGNTTVVPMTATRLGPAPDGVFPKG